MRDTELEPQPPTLREVDDLRNRLTPYLRDTPVLDWLVGDERLVLKLELMQVTGSFKARGALATLLDLPAEARKNGVVAVSAGNHGIAVAYAARQFNTPATIVMPETVDPARLAATRAEGATVEHTKDIKSAFARALEIAEGGRTLIHPFEGETIARGTGTLGLDILRQVPDLEAVVIPIGGGGLAAGVASVLKQAKPDCKVFGVEPFGADSMTRSLATGQPAAIEKVDTIADSLGAPYALPYSFSLVRRFVDQVVRVDDDALRAAMRLLYDQCKLAVEPAGAAATAAALGPLAKQIAGRRTVLIVCGANIAPASFLRLLGHHG